LTFGLGIVWAPGFHAGWLLVLDVGLGMSWGGVWRGQAELLVRFNLKQLRHTSGIRLCNTLTPDHGRGAEIMTLPVLAVPT
jgi:hypothetical protein